MLPLFTNPYFTTTSIILTCLTPTPASYLAQETRISPHTQTLAHLLTFSDDDRDSVGALQLPLISYCQGKLVPADRQACHCGNSAVYILNLHITRTADGRTEIEGESVKEN